MLSIFVALVFLCFGIWLRIKWNGVRQFWAKRGVPHYSPHPIMGNMSFLQKENPAFFMRKMYNDFKSPYVGMWVFWRPALIINSPELARRILVKDFDVFRNRFLSSGKSDPVGGLNLFTVNDPIWTSVRRRLTTVFTAAKLRSLKSLTVEKTKDMVERVRNESQKGDIQNLREVFVDFTTDVMGESAFGISTTTSRNGNSVMKDVTREYMKFDLFRGLSWSSIFFFPELVDIFGFSLFPKDTTVFMRKLFRSIVEQRGGYDREVRENKDLLDALLNMRNEAAAENEFMSEDLLLAQASIFLVGGFDSSGAALTWATYELAFQPDLQDKLYEELRNAKNKNRGKEFDPTTLAELTYLNAVIKETLRKYPPLGWLDRIAATDYKIDDHLTIPAGTIVYVNCNGLHQDPNYFSDPGTFLPDRFLPENEKTIKPYTYMPFGDGPRGCIGKRFAYQTIRYGLSYVFLHFSVRPVPGAPRPNCASVETRGMFYMPGQSLSVTFIPR